MNTVRVGQMVTYRGGKFYDEAHEEINIPSNTVYVVVYSLVDDNGHRAFHSGDASVIILDNMALGRKRLCIIRHLDIDSDEILVLGIYRTDDGGSFHAHTLADDLRILIQSVP